ncbi:type II secretion system F family protein [Streptomyces sp. NPDC050703]|uniref:type II secretion system F family protein n=1 Tax=Streptomyces sp. NPDC050703 TaxID=3157218 RepID=UPI0034395634
MWAAAVCAGGAAWLMGGRDKGAGRVHAVLAVPVSARTDDWSWWRVVTAARARMRHEWWCLAAGLLVAFLGASVVPLVAGPVAVPLVRRVRRARDARVLRERRGAAVIALCGALASEVRAGRQPGDALRLSLGGEAARGLSEEARSAALAAARFGGEVPDALREAAREPGAEGLLGLAACWRVAVDRGAGLAAGLERLEAALRSERDQRAELRAQLAGARSTAVMLAGLPVLGLLMGSALGAEPLRVLLHTGAGLGCLAAGAVLEGAGMWWALRIVRGAEGR